MYNLSEFLSLLEEFAPLDLSRKMIEKGNYDNSGIIVKNHDRIQKILFTLDLSSQAVEYAKQRGCDTVVTHHPAIYNPISSLGVTQNTVAVLAAVKADLNVISMHLNLDVADGGIDECLSKGLKGKNQRVIEHIDGKHGYGREADVEETVIESFVNDAIVEFSSDKIIYYGRGAVKKIASFCGGGSGDAINAVSEKLTDADTVITSDIPHHVLLALLEAGKKVVVIPHYVAENYGFNKFYQSVSRLLKDGAQAYYFTDKRFM